MIILGVLAIVIGVLLASRPAGRRTRPALPAPAEEEPTAEIEPPPPPPRELRLGDSFSRAEIRAVLGGSVQETFPHVGGRVVGGCFHPGFHPYAPFVVLPGFTPGVRRWARALAAQEEAIPCFLFRASNAWEYVGRFRAAALSEDPDEVAEWARIAEREDDVSMVLHLEEADDEADAEADDAAAGDAEADDPEA